MRNIEKCCRMGKIKNILYIMLMLMISMPLIQRTMPLFPETPLKGSFSMPEKPEANRKAIFDGSFQEAYNNYFEHTIGFRPFLVRLNNQVAYTLFDTAQAAGVVIGKEKYLYEINYIKAYKGWDFVGREKITEQAGKAAFVNEKLKAAGKTLLFVMAPGKASFFPEYIPDKYMAKPSGEATNAKVIRQEFGKLDLPLLDFNEWFVSMKDTATYPLYPQCGIHWSAYGVALALDSLIKVIEREQHINMIGFGWSGFDLPDTLRNPDYDIAEGMNLLFPIRPYRMAYPRLRFGPESGRIKPNAIVIADSYYWNIYGEGISARLFGSNNFWYYNEEAFNPEWENSRKVSELNLMDELSNADVIIVMATEANLYRFPYGFIDQVYDALNRGEQLYAGVHDSAGLTGVEARLQEIMRSIEMNPEYRALIQKKAGERGISYREMLRLDAEWILQHEAD